MVHQAIRSMTYSENFMNKDGDIYDNISTSCDALITQMQAILEASKGPNGPSNIALFCLGVASKMVLNEMADIKNTIAPPEGKIEISIVNKLIDKVIEYHTDLAKDLTDLIYDDVCCK